MWILIDEQQEGGRRRNGRDWLEKDSGLIWYAGSNLETHEDAVVRESGGEMVSGGDTADGSRWGWLTEQRGRRGRRGRREAFGKGRRR